MVEIFSVTREGMSVHGESFGDVFKFSSACSFVSSCLSPVWRGVAARSPVSTSRSPGRFTVKSVARVLCTRALHASLYTHSKRTWYASLWLIQLDLSLLKQHRKEISYHIALWCNKHAARCHKCQNHWSCVLDWGLHMFCKLKRLCQNLSICKCLEFSILILPLFFFAVDCE